jgi:hypothetical protein
MLSSEPGGFLSAERARPAQGRMTDLVSRAHDGKKGETDKKSIMCLKTIASRVPVRLAIIIGDS